MDLTFREHLFSPILIMLVGEYFDFQILLCLCCFSPNLNKINGCFFIPIYFFYCMYNKLLPRSYVVFIYCHLNICQLGILDMMMDNNPFLQRLKIIYSLLPIETLNQHIITLT